jgi:glyoxylase-like metal-dependent hydrolase (beta-lactamase superfamily II)
MPGLNLPSGMHVFERGWLSANNILFTDGDETLMVDSGYCTHSAQTLSLVEGVLGKRPLDTLVNTHLHSDHCGGNSALQTRYPDMSTLIPPGHAAQVRNWDAVALTYLPTGQLCPKFHFNRTLQPGTSIQFGATPWEIHAAAGHDPHSVVFFEPIAKTLISADALWENGFGVVFPELEGITAFSEVSATLDLIEQLEPRVVVPGHGRMFSYTTDVMQLSRQRLNAFIKNPTRHAQHAAKVLLKFKLLELQRSSFQEFVEWATATPYLLEIHAKFFGGIPAPQWIISICDKLIKAGVAKRENTVIINI